jgi:hypothetical protein
MARAVKWLLLVLALGWAAYSLRGVWILAHLFPQASESNSGLSNMLAGAQLFAVTLGPLVLAIVILLVPLPLRRRR